MAEKPQMGRPTLYGDRMVTRNVNLPEAAWQEIKARYGGDTYSASLRRALLRLVELEGERLVAAIEENNRIVTGRIDTPYRIEFDTTIRPGLAPSYPPADFFDGGSVIDAATVQAIDLTLSTDRGEVVDTTVCFAVLENARRIKFSVDRLRHRRVYRNGID